MPGSDTIRQNVARTASIQVPATGNPAIMGVSEVTEFLGVHRPTLWTWLHSAIEHYHAEGEWPVDSFPQPIAHLAAGPIWLTAEVERFRRTSDDLRKFYDRSAKRREAAPA